MSVERKKEGEKERKKEREKEQKSVITTVTTYA